MQLFYYLPKCAIAAIVIVAAARLIEFEFHYQYKVSTVVDKQIHPKP
jgi:MFS superfamily sulfate permease-like transporter